MAHKMSFRCTSASLTHVGKVRSINEDACLALPEKGLWVVADGMGGHDAGDVASTMIVETLRIVPDPQRFSEYVTSVEDALQSVNTELVALANSNDNTSTIGSTVVALVAYANYICCLWAGDSRLYLLRDRSLTQVTQDHSQVEELIAQGEILRKDSETHPAANVITRAVGATDELFLEMELLKLQHKDQLMLCSDGLYKDVNETQILQCMQDQSAEVACESLLDLALQSGGRDNVTVVCINVEKVDENPMP